MPQTQLPTPSAATRAEGGFARPGVTPLLPILAPLVVAAILLSVLFSHYLASFAPSVTAPIVHFTDVTKDSGIVFVHDDGGSGDDQLSPTTLGSGVAVLDYDGDGAPDLFFVNGATWPWIDPQGSHRGTCALYHNDGHGHFTDVTAQAGLGLHVQGMGVAIGDYDNDGRPDIFVTGLGENHLFHNRGDGSFEDVTVKAGLEDDGRNWSTGALWLDLDGDGLLDLIVCRYARWSSEVDLHLAFNIANGGRSYGAPAGFVGASPAIYHNLGHGKFAEDLGSTGLSNISPDTRLPRAETLVVAPFDLNGDGRLDLVFFYHNADPTLFLNDGHGHFHEWAPDADRQEGSATGLLALNALPLPGPLGPLNRFGAVRALNADDKSSATVMNLPSRMGLAFLDYDLDGRLEIFSGEGRAEPDLNRFDEGRDFMAAPRLWWNRGSVWQRAPSSADSNWERPIKARGVAVADLDGDGDLDVVVTQNGGPAKVFRNDQRTGVSWLRIRLVGTHGPRDGTGARVEVRTPTRTQTLLAAPAMGYLSQSENILTFGLGEDARVRRVRVVWPNGNHQDMVPDHINQTLVIEEK